MGVADKIFRINTALLGHMESHGIWSLTADEAANIVYQEGLILPNQGPPGARGFAFRQYLRDLRDKYGPEKLKRLTGASQTGSQARGRWTIVRFEALSLEDIREIIGSEYNDSGSFRHSATEKREAVLSDVLTENLDVVFVGTSVGEESARRKHYYAHHTNRFWDLVREAGLVSGNVDAETDQDIVHDRCGLTDLVKRKASSSDSRLVKADFDVSGFKERILQFKPKVIAFNGKRAYSEVFRSGMKYGLSENKIGASFVFVLPSSSGADTSMEYAEKLEWYKKLKEFVQSLERV